MQPGAALSAQAESRQDPTRVGSRPDPGFARLGEACPLLSLSASARRRPHCLACLGCALPASLGFGQATPCSLARLLQRRLNLGRTPPEWAPGQNRPSPGRERLHPPPLPRRRPCPMARLRPRRLNLGRTPPEWAPCPTLDLPGGKRLLPPLHCSASAWRRPCRQTTPSATKAESGPGATRVGSRPDPGFARWGEASPEPLGFSHETPLPPGAPSAAQAESGLDPTRACSRPDPGFARWGEAAPSPASLGLGPATPMQAVPSPESLGFGPATPIQSGAPSAAQAESGLDPTRVGSLPDPGFAQIERDCAHPCVSRLRPGDALAALRASGRAG